jgi:hypothetical protein
MTIKYRVTEAPSIDLLADSWKYVFRNNQMTVRFKVERDHVQQGQEPHLVKFEMADCQVLGLEHIASYPSFVSVKLYVPSRQPRLITHNATALIEYPRRKGTLECFPA